MQRWVYTQGMAYMVWRIYTWHGKQVAGNDRQVLPIAGGIA